MKIVYSPLHTKHHPPFEFRRGEKIPAFEIPDRVANIVETLRQRSFGEWIGPENMDLPLQKIHDSTYLQFLKEIYPRWHKAELDGDLVPYCWPPSTPIAGKEMPQDIFGQLGYFGGDADTPILAGTWEATYAAAACAATATKLISSGAEQVVFSLSRPPGHHAGKSRYAGYCFLNHAAIACEQLLEDGMEKVALLDIDYHHGDGSQAIFYDRSDVLFLSLHADPDYEYPFFSGRSHEEGIGKGKGYTKNYPLAIGTNWDTYRATLEQAITHIHDFQANALVISLGLDISERDLLGKFKLGDEVFGLLGEICANIALPSVIILEGGYAVQYLGGFTYDFLYHFEQTIMRLQ